MKKKKLLKFLKIVFALIIIVAGIFIYLGRGAQVDISYDSDFTLGKPVEITIKTYNNYQLYSPESLTVSLSNKYNKNASFSTEIKPYAIGKYQLLVTPSYAGEYQLVLKYQDQGVEKTFNDSFLIE